MQTLKAIQESFYHTIFNIEQSPAAFIKSDHADERLNIYRQTILENLRHALEITYPGVWVLLGKECADSAAYAFFQQTENLPLTGNLDEWGMKFPLFLSKQPELSGLPYLKTYAEYEWLKHLAYAQLESPYITYSDLVNISENDIARCKLDFHPSVYLMQSDFPLDQIQEIIQNPKATGFNLNKDHTFALIARPENFVIVYWITKEYFLFFQNISNKLTLSECINNTESQYQDFNFSEVIDFLITNKLLSGITK